MAIETVKKPYEFLVRWDQDGKLVAAHVQWLYVSREDGVVVSAKESQAEPVAIGKMKTGFPVADILDDVTSDSLIAREDAEAARDDALNAKAAAEAERDSAMDRAAAAEAARASAITVAEQATASFEAASARAEAAEAELSALKSAAAARATQLAEDAAGLS